MTKIELDAEIADLVATQAHELVDCGLGEMVDESATGPGPMLRRFSDVAPIPVEWLWPNVFAIGKLNLLFGDPGLGKSFFAIYLASRISTGSPWPDGSGRAPLGTTIILNCEDDVADTLRPRADAAGADPTKLIALDGVRLNATKERAFTLGDIPRLEEAIQANPDTKLVTIDPISAYLGKADSHNNAEVRGLLAPLAKLATDYRVCILMITHMSKAAGGRALNRSMGSIAFGAASRSAWLLARDPQDPKRRLFLPAKNNIGNDQTGLAFRIINGACTFEREPVTTRADDLVGEPESAPGPEPEARKAAEEWLRQLLSGGAVSSKKVEEESKAAGMAPRTVRRAADAIGVKREKCKYSGGWQWRLPNLAKYPPPSDNMDNKDNMDIFPISDTGEGEGGISPDHVGQVTSVRDELDNFDLSGRDGGSNA